MIKVTEHQHQCAVVEWARMSTNIGNLLFSIPNGTYLGAGNPYIKANYGKKLVREGLVKGVPDLFLAIPVATHPGMFIEMKTKGGVVSDNQIKMMEGLRKMGYKCAVAYNAEEAISSIRAYMHVNQSSS